MNESILNDVKKWIGLDKDYNVFDSDIIMFINSVFFNLCQLGVGPKDGFHIESEKDKWSDFITDESILSGVKPYIQQKVRIQFDPPTNSSLENSIRNNIKEYEWRLNMQGDR